MKRFLLAVAALAALACTGPAAVAADGGQAVGQRVYTYAVQIDGNGRIGQIARHGGQEDALGRELAAEARTWLFSPSTRPGDSSGAEYHTFLRLVVAPGAEPGNYELVSATTGPAPRELVLPHYPVREQRAGYEGTVVMKLAIGEDGRVLDAQVDSVHGKVSRSMVSAARRVAPQWKFVPERVDARPVSSTVLWPVCFLGAASSATECAWNGPEAQRYSSKMVLALDPVARRVTPLAFER